MRELCIDHIAIAVVDLDEAVRWYRDCLGFEELERRTTNGERTAMVSAVMCCGSAVVVLVQGTTPDSQVSRFVDHFGAGVQHVAFAVDDLDQAIEKLISVGGALDVDVIQGEGIRQAFLRRDPGSGVRVELIERRGGTFNDQSVEKLFKSLEGKNLY